MSTGNTGFSRGIIFVLSLFTSTIYAEAAVIGNTQVSVRTPASDVRYARGDSMQLRVVGNRDGRFVLRWQVPPELSCLLFRVERAVTEGYRFTEERRWVEIGVIPGLCSLFDTVPYFYEDRGTQSDISGSLQYRLAVRQTNGDTFYSYSEVITLGSPDRFEILDVYPQPSAGLVTMNLLLPSDAPVSLRVHDTQGREVFVSRLQPSAPGPYAFSLDLSSLPPGLYFTYMETPDGVIRRSLRLIR